MDQHLFAEFREIKMVPKSLRRSLLAAEKRDVKAHGYKDGYVQKMMGQAHVLLKVPPAFTLNTGHVSFFYNKGAYLRERYEALRVELRKRGINFDETSLLDDAGVFASLPAEFNQQYTPTEGALELVRQRIAEKIALRPRWYRFHRKVI